MAKNPNKPGRSTSGGRVGAEFKSRIDRDHAGRFVVRPDRVLTAASKAAGAAQSEAEHQMEVARAVMRRRRDMLAAPSRR